MCAERPYNVLGTLQEQITYPEQDKNARTISHNELRSILERVDLAYLLDRDGVLEMEINWQEEISLGEQQRLAIARLLYHKPKFAILDECTSGCSAAIENELYAIASELSISVITISHRPALLAYHDRMLAIGDGKQGWTLTDVDRSKYQLSVQEATARARKAAVASQQQAAVAHVETRSAPYESLHKRKTQSELEIRSKGNAFSRFMSVMAIGLPNGRGRLLLLLAVLVVKTRVEVSATKILGEMMGCLVSGAEAMWRYWVGMSIGNGAVIVGLRQIMNYLTRSLHSDMKVNISNRLMELYFKNRTFYNSSNIDKRISNPEMRMADDVRDFSENLAEAFEEIASPLIDMAVFSFSLRTMLGTNGLGWITLYLFGGLFVVKKLMPDYKDLIKLESEIEGKFKFVHARVRSHAESIAFFGGGSRERVVAENHFAQWGKMQRAKVFKVNIQFGLPNQYFTCE